MTSPHIDTITLGGGCFWCVEAVYERVRGVTGVESGYCNGHVDHPTYEQVCSGDTGHVEVVRVSFDTAEISLREVLEIFFVVHDPTSKDRQGNDVGSQYRSGVYYTRDDQATLAREVIAEVEAKIDRKVVTVVEREADYSTAEAYHQHYFANHPGQGYCAMVVAPKVQKFVKTFSERVKD